MFSIVNRLHFLSPERPGYAATAPVRPFARRLAGASILARHWIASTRQGVASRRELRDLDDRMLKDLGISRAQAEFLASRPVRRVEAGTTDRI